MGMTTKHQLELGRRHELPDYMLDVVPHNPFGRGKVSNPHPDDPPLHITDGLAVLPLLNVFAHTDIFGLPMVRLHFSIKVVGPGIFQREEVESHCLLSEDHPLARKSGLGLLLVEDELPPSHCKFGLHHFTCLLATALQKLMFSRLQ